MDHGEIHKKLTSFLPMRGIERKIYAAVSLCILSGVTLSLSFCSWSWLNSFGALIIIIGIWFTWRDFTSTIGSYTEAKRQELLQLISRFEERRPRGLISGAMHEGDLNRLRESENDLKDLRILMVKRLRFTEATILILGTFINGFGGLILDLVAPFN